jgi:TPR repeat protein
MAQYYYGLCLRDGEGVALDVAEAARYFRLAAAQGYTDAPEAAAALQKAQPVAGGDAAGNAGDEDYTQS